MAGATVTLRTSSGKLGTQGSWGRYSLPVGLLPSELHNGIARVPSSSEGKPWTKPLMP
jgi:hypothetical protein